LKIDFDSSEPCAAVAPLLMKKCSTTSRRGQRQRSV
jgi:hypothetical protein